MASIDRRALTGSSRVMPRLSRRVPSPECPARRAVDGLVAVLQKRGSRALGTPATVYGRCRIGRLARGRRVCSQDAATRAGLGWIGKTGLFVSPEGGPKVRLATVFTDLDLDVAYR